MLAQVIPMVGGKFGAQSWEDWKEGFLWYTGEQMEGMNKKNSIEPLSDISAMLWNTRAEILGKLALAFVRKRFGDLLSQEHCSCPLCGKILKRRGVHRSEIVTLSARFDLERPYFYCVPCAHGFYPLDEALELSASAKQHDVQELATWLAAELPFEVAEDAMNRSTGIEMSDPAIHETVKKVLSGLDVLDVCPGKEEIFAKIAEFSKGKQWRPAMMLTVDGALAPVRCEPSTYKGKRGKGDLEEVKGFRFYLVDKDRIEHFVSWHQIGSADELAAALQAMKDAGLVPEDRVRLCVVADGAAWIWNRIEQVFPKAKQVLDYYHCSEHLHDLAAAQYGQGTRKALEWVAATLLRLFLKQKRDVIARHQKNEARLGGSGEANQTNRCLPEKTLETPRLRPNSPGWLPYRERRHRKFQQTHFPCPTEATRGMVVSEQCQQHPQTPLCQVQRHLRESNAATPTEGSKAKG